MNLGRVIARNILSNWAGLATQMLAGFVVLPFLVQCLGAFGYGLWILIASLTGYFELLDFGLRGSMNRSIAFHRARNDVDGVNTVFSTGMAILLAATGVIFLLTLAAVPLFLALIEVPADEVASVRMALFLIGVNLALMLPLSAFDGVLWGYQRFDLLNGVDIPAVLLRTGLTFWLLRQGGDLVTLAWITLAVTVVSGMAKAALVVCMDRRLKLRAKYVSRATARELYGFGIWCFLVYVGRTLATQAGPQIIGSQLGVALVTPYSVAARLVGYVFSLLQATTGVLTPVTTALHAEGKHAQQRALFLQGGKYSFALALFFLGLYVCLGGDLMHLWIRRDLEFAQPLLLILILGEVLPLSQQMTYSLVLGMSRHRLWACMSLLEVALIVAGSAVALALDQGVLGIGVAVAVPGALCRGLVPMIYGCRLVRLPLWQYASRALAPGLLTAALPVLLLAVLARWHEPASWAEFFAYGGFYALCFAAAGSVLLVGVHRIKLRGGDLLRQVFGAPAEHTPST